MAYVRKNRDSNNIKKTTTIKQKANIKVICESLHGLLAPTSDIYLSATKVRDRTNIILTKFDLQLLHLISSSEVLIRFTVNKVIFKYVILL